MALFLKFLRDNLINISLIGIAAFSFNLIIMPDQPVLQYDYKRLFICTIILINCIILISSRSSRNYLIVNILQLHPITLTLLFLFFLFSFIANIFGLYPYRGITDYFYYIGLFLLIVSLSNSKPGKFQFEAYALISVLCYLSVFIGFTVTNLYGDGSSIWTILSYTNPRMLNQVQVWIIIPSIYVLLTTSKKKAYIPIVLNFSILFALSARGAFIAIVCGVILWGLLDKKNRNRILTITITCIVIGYLIKLLTLSPIPSFLFHGEFRDAILNIRTSDSGRLDLWLHALEMVSFWGHGGDAFVCNSLLNGRPHNSILLVLVNWGIIPALAYVFLILALLMSVVTKTSPRSRMFGVTLLSGIAYSLISGTLDSPFSLLLGCITLANYWNTLRTLNIDVKYAFPTHLIVIIIASLTLASIATKVNQRVSNGFYLDEAYIPEVYIPQFWYGNNCINTEMKIKTTLHSQGKKQ
ncbi:O-antigen ligase family protein [Vibrio superstes]|uniref:O-antigen ligase-related domain-containing protein n=1 Tax=Vibrio superstes NBRC 103154 TaxID=1219062 RepID=A0A511QS35_9VIBR|nr:O-antigen ligase family protein [Vibrio superstes]GEM80165.1 hypothetical protein VSU01S_24100 [Vibrio superstes NBRC 103154]